MWCYRLILRGAALGRAGVIALALLASVSRGWAGAAETLTRDLSSKAGVKWEFRPAGGHWLPIGVPEGGWRAQGYDVDAGTYRATIQIPTEAGGRQVRVAFAAVNFGAEVSAGPDVDHLEKVAAHVNGWMPFTADVTRLAPPGGSLLLVVEVRGRNVFQAGGKFTVPEGASWFKGLADGIIRGVALEMVPPVRVADVFTRTTVGPDVLRPEVRVVNDSSDSATLTVEAAVSSEGKQRGGYPAIPPATVTLAPGTSSVVDLGRAAWTAGPGSYWWPNVPYRAGYRAQLHSLEVSLKVDGKVVHQIRQRFGFREFRVRGDHYELNGVRCNLRGDNQQEANFNTDAYGIRPGFGPPSGANPGWPRAVDNLLRLNFNVLRIHQIPATPYMLDVCDELGLMIVDETPIRGSEGREDWKAGREPIRRYVGELAARDRRHPAVVVWSAANEWSDPIPEIVPLMRAVDDTRPIIADGVGEITPEWINMEHYVGGLGVCPVIGGAVRKDRPYGETEAVWPMDNTWQGFAWMATATRARRLRGDADIRNYVLNNAWPNYVPGEGPETEVLEKKVKNMGGDMEFHAALADPWNHQNIRLMQQCYAPITACDTGFDRDNARSNAKGEWPVYRPRLSAGSVVRRPIAVFNDEFHGTNLTLRWETRAGGSKGPVLAKGESSLTIPPGERAVGEITFNAPSTPGPLALSISVSKDGHECFREDRMVFDVVEGSTDAVKDGDYRLICRLSGLAASVAGTNTQPGAAVVQGETGVWRVRNAGDREVRLNDAASGLALGVRDDSAADAAAAVLQAPSASRAQVWRIEEAGEGWVTLVNAASGKALDAFRKATNVGSELVQYGPNGGDNQQWQFRAARR